jgi:ATP-binding cassette subfamily F protein uup
VLVLDEPTNDLDIDTLELLESLLQDFPGTLFLVSHDRAFLENTVTQVIAFEGNGQLTEFGGGYDDWLRFTEQRTKEAANAPKVKIETPKPAATSAPTKTKLSYKDQLELDQLPEKVESLEIEQAAINATLADPEIYKTDLGKATALQIKLTELDEALINALARWEELESKK